MIFRADSTEQSESLNVAVCQLTSIDDVRENLQQILDLLKELESHPPDLICFPENALYMRVTEGSEIPAIDLQSPEVLALAKWAKQFHSTLHIGSVPVKRDGQLYNSSLVIAHDGSVHDVYQKIHLFDVDVEGHKPVRESDVFAHGLKPAVFYVKGWKIGSTICYDLRFGELFAHYAREEVDLLLIPSAFLVPTGKAHWEVLTRARAIECQAYVLAAAQGGTHFGKAGGQRSTYGHSMIIDPWGVVIESSPQAAGPKKNDLILSAVLSRDTIRRVRAQIPMKGHRRL